MAELHELKIEVAVLAEQMKNLTISLAEFRSEAAARDERIGRDLKEHSEYVANNLKARDEKVDLKLASLKSSIDMARGGWAVMILAGAALAWFGGQFLAFIKVLPHS